MTTLDRLVEWACKRPVVVCPVVRCAVPCTERPVREPKEER